MANSATMNTTGTITYLMSHLVSNNWIIDTGVTNYMAHNLNLLSNIRKLSDIDQNSVQLLNGEKVIISHTGDLSLFKDKSVHHVLYILDFKFNLMSVSKITKELRCLVAFFPDFCIFQELFTGKVMGIGKEEHGIYILEHKEQDVPKQLPDSRPFHSSSSVNTTSSEFQTNNASAENKNTSECPNETVLWHKRLGHAPLRVLKRIQSLPNVQLKDHFCTVCHVAKQTRVPFPSSNACSINAFDLIHVDVWEPYRVSTHNGRKYFMTLVDDYSRFIWLFLMNDNEESIVILKNFLLLVKNQFHCSTKCLRSDNGTKFFNNQVTGLLQEHGIVHQRSCVYTPQQNGRVDRRHRSILDIARALRFQACVPLQFWVECVTTIVYILNRLPTIVLKGVSPFERLFHRSPSLQHLRVFGSLCYATNLKKTDKFCPRAILVVHLGYSSSQKGYVLYDLSSKLFFVSRYTVFREGIFLFKHLHTTPSPLFPILDFRDIECPNLSSSDVFTQSSSSSPSQPPLNASPSSHFPSPLSSDHSPSSFSTSHSSSLSLPSSTYADLRRSSRVSKPPIWMEDYIVMSKISSCAHPIS
uniref:Integrase catalytic domain-containing protein n=1 Tax=Nicotiana tabacum TaxID=4097 RepID=A0A1S3Y353_TOBAC|nr:PREDICTED: uncharacterized protein LOC107771645 [Nicotiana tabacum]